jgi:protein bicaudal C
MMFDLPDGMEIIDSEVQKIGEDLDVAISIKPKHRQGSKSVLIKAQERSASTIYSARYRLLKVDDLDEEGLVVADIPESYKIQPIPAHMLQSLGGKLHF